MLYEPLLFGAANGHHDFIPFSHGWRQTRLNSPSSEGFGTDGIQLSGNGWMICLPKIAESFNYSEEQKLMIIYQSDSGVHLELGRFSRNYGMSLNLIWIPMIWKVHVQSCKHHYLNPETKRHCLAMKPRNFGWLGPTNNGMKFVEKIVTTNLGFWHPCTVWRNQK